LNNKQGHEKEHATEGGGVLQVHQRRGRVKELITMQTFSKQRLERQKDSQQADDKLLPEIWQIVVHKAHLLSW
jgi:hypothetical protein